MESTEESETLRGVLKRVRFSNESGSFSVSELEVENRAMPVTLVGNILATRPGETVEVNGVWQNDRRYGRQFRIQRIYSVPPTNREGIRRYLSSGMIEGIGPVLAGRIVEHFGAETLDVIDEDPTRIREVDGIGARRAESIAAAWDEQREIRTIMVFLQSHGISQSHATKIYETYGERAIDIIQNNPYRLAEDIWGIGFKTADAIASEAGIRRDAMTRLRAGVVHVLREAHGDGHMYLPLPELLARASELLGVARDALGAAIEKLKYEDKIAVEPAGATLDTPAVYRGGAYRTEVDAARHLARLLEGGGLLPAADLDVELERAEERMGIELADAQRRAALAPWSDKLVVLTGGPGTGKTTIVRAVCALGEHLGRRLALAAPTGRAARRLAEATGRPAQTVHRLLEYSFKEGGFQRDEERPLDVDLLIVDEASMVDTYLLGAIARALPDRASLMLVGDIDQLPSVGPGDVLADIIRSEVGRVVRLTEIFRQARESYIVRNAHRINRGQMPIDPPGDGEVDFYTISAEEPERARDKIIELVTERIEPAFGYEPIEDVQILSPMHRGVVGCTALNAALQERFNRGQPTLERGSRSYRVGEKVMQMRNNYELEVFNGDIGRIVSFDDDTEHLRVRFDDRVVEYPYASMRDLGVAYAITIHKSQGSEYPVVVIPVLTQHYIMLQRNLLYTAVTRASQMAILVGSERAVEIAVRNRGAQHRHTRLDRRLRERVSQKS